MMQQGRARSSYPISADVEARRVSYIVGSADSDTVRSGEP